MFRLASKFLGFSMFILLALSQGFASGSTPATPPATETAPARTTAPRKRVSKRTKRAAHVQQPYTIAPMTPELLPASPPQVSYLNGQLTIQSVNSTLADILNTVRVRTGAQLDTPAGFGSERVATRLGPGSPSEVVNSLLSGSKFGYVILGAPDNPGAVQKIIVTGVLPTVTTASGAAVPDPGRDRRGGRHGQRPERARPDAAPQPEPMEEPMEVEAEPPEPVTPQMPNPPPPGMPQAGQPELPPGSSPSAPPAMPPEIQAPPQQQNPGQPQVKTPEQLLQELQRMRNQGGQAAQPQ